MPKLDFPTETLPWGDRESFLRESERRLAAGELSTEDAEAMRRWRSDGYLSLPVAIEAELIDAMLAEYERAWETRPKLKVTVEGQGAVPFAKVAPRPELTRHFRVMDFHDVSPAARRVMFHPRVVAGLRLILEQAPVAMQSLFFEYGSEQAVHQDFPYVQAKILSHLVGCWIALEDVGPDNGPLFYYPGSHRVEKFDWGGGSLRFDGVSEHQVPVFEAHLEQACQAAGLEKQTFHAAKGDVFLWHSALAHGGSAVASEQTRKSLVAHFSTRVAYPRDRRWPYVRPEAIEVGGGLLYQVPSLARRVVSKIGSKVFELGNSGESE